MKHRGDGLFSGAVEVAKTLHVEGERIRPALFIRGATWIRGVNAILVPTNTVPIYIPRKSILLSGHVLTQGGVGSCSIDVRKVPFSSYPPTGLNSITGGNYLTISSGITHQNLTLTGWNTALDAGDVLDFNLLSSSIFTAIYVTMVMKEVE